MRLIQSLIPEELRDKISQELRADRIHFTLADEFKVSIEVFIGDTTGLNPDDYECTPIRTPYQGERQFVPLLSSNNRTTFGYIFPISTLLTGSEITDDFAKLYAALAVHHLLFKGLANHLTIRDFSDSNFTDVSITELFPSDLGVMILWKQKVTDTGYTSEEVKLLVQVDAFSLYPDTSPVEAIPKPVYDKNFVLPSLSGEVKGEIGQLLSIITAAKEERTEAGKFLGYYQVIEYFIAKIFRKAVALIIDDTKSGFDPWELKERLNTVTSETWRLQRLEDKFLLPSKKHGHFSECTKACNELLDIVIPNSDGTLHNYSWAKSLYLTRNMFVHRAIELERCPADTKARVCDALPFVCYEIMTNYTDAVTLNSLGI